MMRFLLLCALALPLAAADPEQSRVEVGVLVGGIREGALGEYPVVGGGRISARVFRFIDAEAEVNRLPIGGASSLYPATLALFGIRAGRRFGPIGVYGKLRPGFIRFDANPYVPMLGTGAAFDAGGIIEFYSRHHVAGRIDLGDTAVWYGSGTVIPPVSGLGGYVTAGTRHQLEWSVGLSAWF